MTDTARFVLGIIGIIGGILCAIADLLWTSRIRNDSIIEALKCDVM